VYVVWNELSKKVTKRVYLLAVVVACRLMVPRDVSCSCLRMVLSLFHPHPIFFSRDELYRDKMAPINRFKR
jgi:hypothetical protein